VKDDVFFNLKILSNQLQSEFLYITLYFYNPVDLTFKNVKMKL